MNKPIQRNASMDLLKIIAIYLVVLTHSATKSKFTFLDGYSAARIEVQMCELGGFADGLFFMISGYFLILSKSTTHSDIKKCLRIIIKSAIYSIVLLGVFNRFNIELRDIYDAALSALNGKYWFITVYIVIYIFHQYINTCLRNISQIQFKKLIELSFVL